MFGRRDDGHGVGQRLSENASGGSAVGGHSDGGAIENHEGIRGRGGTSGGCRCDR